MPRMMRVRPAKTVLSRTSDLEAIERFIAERGVTQCDPGDGGAATDICAYCTKRIPLRDFPISSRTGNRSGVCRWCKSSVWTRDYAVRRGDRDAKRISALEIYERDNWTCQICGEPIDPDLSAPHSMSKTTDHIVPLSRGGKHVVGNIQAAHLYCNISKGNRLAGSTNAARARRQKALGQAVVG
jgi:5-methylcytosine-specific restriction endonuclease McrA